MASGQGLAEGADQSAQLELSMFRRGEFIIGFGTSLVGLDDVIGCDGAHPRRMPRTP